MVEGGDVGRSESSSAKWCIRTEVPSVAAGDLTVDGDSCPEASGGRGTRTAIQRQKKYSRACFSNEVKGQGGCWTPPFPGRSGLSFH